MSVVTFFTSRVACSSMPSTRSAVTLSTRTTTSPSGRKQLSKQQLTCGYRAGSEIRCLSTTVTSDSSEHARQTNHCMKQMQINANGYEGDNSLFVRIGLAAAGVVGFSTLNPNDDSSTSKCESDIASLHKMESNFEKTVTTLLSFNDYLYQDNNEVEMPVKQKRNITTYQPQPAPASSIPGRVIDVVKASVDTASEWEKKAKETVRRIANPSPQTYDVSGLYLTFCGILSFANNRFILTYNSYSE